MRPLWISLMRAILIHYAFFFMGMIALQKQEIEREREKAVYVRVRSWQCVNNL